MSLEAFSDIRVQAETHPRGYAFHKYWARKPHNVVRRALEAAGVRAGDLVVDPFCGSGVPLSEAARLGARSVGCDVSPVAVELTRVTLDPPDPARVALEVGHLLDELERAFAASYTTRGKPLRYAVHATVVACAACGAHVSAESAPKRGRTYTCPGCHARLYFNLENLVATRLLRAVLDDGSELPGESELSSEAAPPVESPPPGETGDHELPHNSRILAFRGMRTRQLFTPRNFAVLSAFASRLESLPEPLRGAARLTLTASAAQCSRLVALRNDMRTGGPAWTVPGFWVPPLHLETNPLSHLRVRLKKLCRGLSHLRLLAGRGPVHRVTLGSAQALLSRSGLGDEKATVVFLDPPYGDSVPYLEFSAIWNGFLGALPDPALDLAVSDRSRGDGTWQKYADDLAGVARGVRQVLADDGRLVVTFNNKDARAWSALEGALAAAGFACRGSFYQHPAVVSAKAQLSPAGSYVGDYYGLFSRDK
jgi:SAM-dependent methyltransferase